MSGICCERRVLGISPAILLRHTSRGTFGPGNAYFWKSTARQTRLYRPVTQRNGLAVHVTPAFVSDQMT